MIPDKQYQQSYFFNSEIRSPPNIVEKGDGQGASNVPNNLNKTSNSSDECQEKSFQHVGFQRHANSSVGHAFPTGSHPSSAITNQTGEAPRSSINPAAAQLAASASPWGTSASQIYLAQSPGPRPQELQQPSAPQMQQRTHLMGVPLQGAAAWQWQNVGANFLQPGHDSVQASAQQYRQVPNQMGVFQRPRVQHGVFLQNQQRGPGMESKSPAMAVYTPTSRLPPLCPPRKNYSYDDDRCQVCWEAQSSQVNPIVKCAGCGVLVHSSCYGVPMVKNIEPWTCNVCNYWKAISAVNSPHQEAERCAVPLQPPVLHCAICCRSQGAMKVGNEGIWVHVTCIIFNEEGPEFRNEQSRSAPINVGRCLALHARSQCQCSVCRLTEGFTVKCGFPGCTKRLHVACAFARGLHPRLQMISVQIPKYSQIGWTSQEADQSQQEMRNVEKLLKIVTCESHSSANAHNAIEQYEKKLLQKQDLPPMFPASADPNRLAKGLPPDFNTVQPPQQQQQFFQPVQGPGVYSGPGMSVPPSVSAMQARMGMSGLLCGPHAMPPGMRHPMHGNLSRGVGQSDQHLRGISLTGMAGSVNEMDGVDPMGFVGDSNDGVLPVDSHNTSDPGRQMPGVGFLPQKLSSYPQQQQQTESQTGSSPTAVSLHPPGSSASSPQMGPGAMIRARQQSPPGLMAPQYGLKTGMQHVPSQSQRISMFRGFGGPHMLPQQQSGGCTFPQFSRITQTQTLPSQPGLSVGRGLPGYGMFDARPGMVHYNAGAYYGHPTGLSQTQSGPAFRMTGAGGPRGAVGINRSFIPTQGPGTSSIQTGPRGVDKKTQEKSSLQDELETAGAKRPTKSGIDKIGGRKQQAKSKLSLTSTHKPGDRKSASLKGDSTKKQTTETLVHADSRQRRRKVDLDMPYTACASSRGFKLHWNKSDPYVKRLVLPAAAETVSSLNNGGSAGQKKLQWNIDCAQLEAVLTRADLLTKGKLDCQFGWLLNSCGDTIENDLSQDIHFGDGAVVQSEKLPESDKRGRCLQIISDFWRPFLKKEVQLADQSDQVREFAAGPPCVLLVDGLSEVQIGETAPQREVPSALTLWGAGPMPTSNSFRQEKVSIDDLEIVPHAGENIMDGFCFSPKSIRLRSDMGTPSPGIEENVSIVVSSASPGEAEGPLSARLPNRFFDPGKRSRRLKLIDFLLLSHFQVKALIEAKKEFSEKLDSPSHEASRIPGTSNSPDSCRPSLSISSVSVSSASKKVGCAFSKKGTLWQAVIDGPKPTAEAGCPDSLLHLKHAHNQASAEAAIWAEIRRLETFVTTKFHAIPPFFIVLRKLPTELFLRKPSFPQSTLQTVLQKAVSNPEIVLTGLDITQLKKTGGSSKRVFLGGFVWDICPPISRTTSFFRKLLKTSKYPVPDERTKELMDIARKAKKAGAPPGSFLSGSTTVAGMDVKTALAAGEKLLAMCSSSMYWHWLIFQDDFVRRQVVFCLDVLSRKSQRLKKLKLKLKGLVEEELSAVPRLHELGEGTEQMKKCAHVVTRWGSIRASMKAGHQDPGRVLMDRVAFERFAVNSTDGADEPRVEDVRSSDNSAAKLHFCAVCFGPEIDNMNLLVSCVGCKYRVHKNCHGIGSPAQLDVDTLEWYCDRCEEVKKPHSLDVKSRWFCAVCLRQEGIMRRVHDFVTGAVIPDTWVHLTCAIWCHPAIECFNVYDFSDWRPNLDALSEQVNKGKKQNVFYGSVHRCHYCDGETSILGTRCEGTVNPVIKRRKLLVRDEDDESLGGSVPSAIFNDSGNPSKPFGHHGLTVRCSGNSTCDHFMHPMCAWLSGLYVQAVDQISNFWTHLPLSVVPKYRQAALPGLKVHVFCPQHLPEMIRALRMPHNVLAKHRTLAYGVLEPVKPLLSPVRTHDFERKDSLLLPPCKQTKPEELPEGPWPHGRTTSRRPDPLPVPGSGLSTSGTTRTTPPGVNSEPQGSCEGASTHSGDMFVSTLNAILDEPDATKNESAECLLSGGSAPSVTSESRDVGTLANPESRRNSISSLCDRPNGVNDDVCDDSEPPRKRQRHNSVVCKDLGAAAVDVVTAEMSEREIAFRNFRVRLETELAGVKMVYDIVAERTNRQRDAIEKVFISNLIFGLTASDVTQELRQEVGDKILSWLKSKASMVPSSVVSVPVEPPVVKVGRKSKPLLHQRERQKPENVSAAKRSTRDKKST